jgi:hypothetical protein
MSYTTLRRFVLVFLVTLVCTASSSWAADWQQLAGEIGRAAWAWLGGYALGGHGTITLKEGCSIDPLGKPHCASITPKAGCSIDPAGNSRCQP